MPSGNGSLTTPAGFNGEYDTLYHNPFAGHSESSFTSAVRPKKTRAETRPTFIRRRGSESAAKGGRNDHEPLREEAGVHVRSRTLDSGISASSSGTSGHPLAPGKSPSGSSTGYSSLDSTRPRLKRLMNDIGPSTDLSAVIVPVPSQTSMSEDSDKVVIVHEVLPTDSLAGVALKYGISLADLRRANQLWTSDSIHLRNVLYIPLEKAQRSRHNKLALSAFEVDNSPPIAPDTMSEGAETRPPELNALAHGINPHHLNIRRIPASQLSFFPPSSSSSTLPIPDSHTLSRTVPRSSHVPQGRPTIPFEFMNSSFSSASHSASSTPPPRSHIPAFTPSPQLTVLPLRSQITSLFNALPIAPSTRDTLMARLSLDSGASTPTQGSEDQEHELQDVGDTAMYSRESNQSNSSEIVSHRHPGYFDRHSGASRDTNNGTALELRSFPSSSSSSRLSTRSRHNSSSHSPSSAVPRHRGELGYASPERVVERPDVVRTAQLEPSPAMQLPFRNRRDRPEGS